MINMPAFGNPQLKLLESLCNASAVSGNEGEVRAIVRKEIQGVADHVHVDALGNVLATRRGTGRDRLKVMLAAHMDEAGFMLVAEDGEGIYRFETVGGMDPRQLAGKQVLVGKDHIPGIIGKRPLHLMTQSERTNTVPADSLRIDIGLQGKATLGDRAVYATRFQRNGPVLISKALDNRLGVVTLIELLRRVTSPRVDLQAAFTVQEELGGRGAKAAAYAFNPDLAIVMDSTPAYDLPTWDGEENTSYNTRLGAGPAIYSLDKSTLSDPRLIRFLENTAIKEKIPYQFRQPGGGGTDAGSIHKQRGGVPSISISVPHRYTHTAASIARLDDWNNYFLLLEAALNNLTPSVMSGDRG